MVTGSNDPDILKWLSIANRYTRIALDRRLQPYRLNASMYYYILRIHEQPKLTQDRLISLTYLNPSNVTRAVNQLVNLGYVRKRQSKTDKRVSELSLTKKGEALYPEIVKLRQEVADGLLTDIPAEQHDALVGQIRQVALRAVANETPGDKTSDD
ncbi:MarR family winged helix-turn-helix transcriptional regulator [Levilactobacillus brevis]|jgi:DNA-binding MarR family transcriptional regulator|uniref:Transcriptional regulator n=3 Tax=Levilactobacillus brevis TaxID=1580 RepID=Q03N77_LEVBA|nr:MarR family transcriptional regulator [Levilactobacillus brevis]MBT1152498.1 MarR family transcriptional regulator [Lactiplantibacillus argentoratensis]ABJ65345.1 Transcriptional regulator [Levilactobacillus brevis ATCC 367]ARQ92925.1 transcriptional regulator [Levilactobacillus brevis]ARW23295.1 putative HTH-type transcriptional regulator YybA [Levilactobacillus brevis]ARW49602.1 putative HTH-type transcriptional regulator YybA [Levilactobacillus brevis]